MKESTKELISCSQSSNDRKSVNEPIVRIPKLGQLRGSIASTKWSNKSFYQFLGVPYAESPSGRRRFKVKSHLLQVFESQV